MAVAVLRARGIMHEIRRKRPRHDRPYMQVTGSGLPFSCVKRTGTM